MSDLRNRIAMLEHNMRSMNADINNIVFACEQKGYIEDTPTDGVKGFIGCVGPRGLMHDIETDEYRPENIEELLTHMESCQTRMFQRLKLLQPIATEVWNSQ